MRKANIGTVCRGSLLETDLIPDFSAELRRLRGALPQELARDVRRACQSRSYMEKNGADIVAALARELDAYAPPYCSFGPHLDDGSDFGFWPFDDLEIAVQENGARIVADTSEVPADFIGDVVHVNDHGNVTLYRARRGALTEIWSIV